jgi:ABC-type protease/lipase transport system fused ATPase/permease subunit
MYLWRMFRYTKKLSWISIWMLLAAMIIIFLLGRRKLKHEQEQMELDSQVASMMFQFLSGISKLRIAGAENRALYEYLRRYTESRKLDIRKEKYNLLATIFSNSVSTIISMVFYYIMVHRSMELSVGEFMGFTAAFGSFSAAMMNLISAYLKVNSIEPSLERMKPILKALPEQQEDAGMPGDLTGAIEVSNITFAYDKNSPPVIRDLSFQIKAGEYIGIIGSSGCGPTSMADIIACWVDKKITPVEMCDYALQKGFRTKNSGTAWGFYKSVFSAYPQGFSKFTQTKSMATLKSALSQGAFAVASMGPGYWTKGGHFICVYKVDSTCVYAKDPASSSRKKQKISQFEKERKQFFIFWPGRNAA